MLTVIVTKTEASYTLESLEEKKVAHAGGRHGALRESAKRRTNQMLMETVSIHNLRWTLQRRG